MSTAVVRKLESKSVSKVGMDFFFVFFLLAVLFPAWLFFFCILVPVIGLHFQFFRNQFFALRRQ